MVQLPGEIKKDYLQVVPLMVIMLPTQAMYGGAEVVLTKADKHPFTPVFNHLTYAITQNLVIMFQESVGVFTACK